MRSGRNGKTQTDSLFPRLSIDDIEKGEPRASPKNKMAVCEESVSMPPFQLSHNSGSERSGSQNHPQKSGSSLFCSLSESSSEMSSDHHSRSSTAEMQMSKTVDYQKVSSTRPSKMIWDNHLFRPFGFFSSENSSLKTLGKEDNFRLPKSSDLDRTLRERGGIDDKSWKEKLSSSLSSSERREEVNSSDFKSAEHLILSTMFGFGTRSPLYQARYDLVNAKIILSDPCEQRSHKVCRTSQENTALLTDGIYEKIEKNLKKRSHSMMESCSSRNDEEKNRIVRMKDSVNACCTRDKNDDLEAGDTGGRSTSISTSVLMVDCKSDSNICPGDVAGIIGPKLFWQVRKTITQQQRIFAGQVFELHRLIKVQRLVAESPEILSEEMLHISNYSTKFSLVKEFPTQTIYEETSSLMKRKVDSQGPNSRLETTEAAQDVHPNLPLIECDAKKKGHITPRDAVGPCAARRSTSSSSSSTIKLGSWYVYPSYQCLIPVKSHSEGLFYKHYAGPGPRSSPVYGSCGVPRLSVTDTDFMMPTSGIRPSSQHGARLQPCSVPVVEASKSSKSSSASKGSDVQESMVRSLPAGTVHGDALSLSPDGSLFQPSYKEIPNSNTEMEGMQVIKVVPHNAKLACESAARIFQSIQEERQKRK